jgi:hypothetical protein
MLLSAAAAVVIVEKEEKERRKKKLFHQKWHRATVAVMSSASLRLVQVDRTKSNFGTKKNYSPTNVFL